MGSVTLSGSDTIADLSKELPPTCRICGSAGSVGSFLATPDLSLVKCSLCSGISVAEQPTREELTKAYHRFNAGEVARENFRAYLDSSRTILESELRRSGLDAGPAIRFLDYGCGAGHFVAAAKALGMDSWGMEVDEFAVNSARRRSLNVHLGMLPDADHELGELKFDVIKCMHVLEHVNHPIDVLRNFARRLAPNGILLIGVPDQASLPSRLKIMLRRLGVKVREYGFVQPPIHLHGFEKRTLEVAGKNAGFHAMWVSQTGPLDRRQFPSAPDYWKGLALQKAVYRLGKFMDSPGHLSAAFTIEHVRGL